MISQVSVRPALAPELDQSSSPQLPPRPFFHGPFRLPHVKQTMAASTLNLLLPENTMILPSPEKLENWPLFWTLPCPSALCASPADSVLKCLQTTDALYTIPLHSVQQPRAFEHKPPVHPHSIHPSSFPTSTNFYSPVDSPSIDTTHPSIHSLIHP